MKMLFKLIIFSNLSLLGLLGCENNSSTERKIPPSVVINNDCIFNSWSDSDLKKLSQILIEFKISKTKNDFATGYKLSNGLIKNFDVIHAYSDFSQKDLEFLSQFMQSDIVFNGQDILQIKKCELPIK
ncbi:MAG TPA: hypothetical protein PLJ21_02355 [Pseudobdellovibrionaceae bacterium]|nr:hypothetical protein [Pseudobdellovibrionaceae bacterium]